MEKKTKEVAGVTFTGDITVMGDMFNIHDNQNVNITNPVKEAKSEEKDSKNVPLQHSERRNEDLFHFIHPSIHGEQEWQIHDEVKRLVSRQGIQEICQYLLQLKDEKKVLLPQNAEKTYNELVRMGMSDGEGYNLKTFMKYYKR